MNILKWFTNNSSFILVLVTLALAIITFYYLLETKRIRIVAEKSLKVEMLPQVFLENIESYPRLDEQKKEISVTAVFIIKNVGKTEAKNFVGKYKLSSGSANIEGKIGPVSYLFPTQGVRYETKVLSVTLNEKNFAVAKDALESKKPLIIPKDFGQPIYLNLSLNYLDVNGETIELPYRLKYLFHSNAWIHILEEETQ